MVIFFTISLMLIIPFVLSMLTNVLSENKDAIIPSTNTPALC